ncbi:bifunctional nicotinamidase/pyrazinamidase [Thermodesulfobacteriota bacterium]
MEKALLIVDVQNDFIPGGALAVNRGDEVIDIANRAMQYFDHVIATQDWHPADHASFASQHEGKNPGELIELNGLPQVLWPDHCVAGSKGSEFAPGLDVSKITRIIKKGLDKEVDSYSTFFDNAQINDTGLNNYLRAVGITDLYITGLATDYCVKYSSLDAIKLGFNTNLIIEGVRGVELNPGDCEAAVEEMKMAGVKIMSIEDLA